ncbi:hypothetical protein TRFO_01442 [Tritrichomonas foetus]|uniref:Rab-GAP TBC domain-containing protein n=1 Tax=Tritrichomonas foetus TaxID=1144522 RepID=A0A1J4K210_9EUKA|nr:hypothetical protein TRFO_01442 [Tritrichomonas foetus]|eukprot:OHT03780.1 hypothetical protein TRFO_01442 [Tritrichomonas foetus]
MESDLTKLIECANVPFRKPYDVKKFLESLDNKKNPLYRIIAWLVSLRIVKVRDIPNSVSQLVQKYKKLAETKLSDFDHPTSSLSQTDAEIITIDTERTIHWFKQLSNECGFVNSNLEERKTSIQRILSILSLCDPFYTYLQGFDRYAFATFLLGLQAADELKTDSFFAEAMSFYLTGGLLKIVDVNKFYTNKKLMNDHFHTLDQKIALARPEIYYRLLEMNCTSIHYALKWELISFADDHSYDDILLIWDNIIVNQKKYISYIMELCTAHIRQIKLADNVFPIESVLHNKEWNTNEILIYSRGKLKQEYQKKNIIIFCIFHVTSCHFNWKILLFTEQMKLLLFI